MALDEADQEKATYTCHMTLFNFRVMVFGLLNAPGVFIQLMAIVLSVIERLTMAYLDDILVFSKKPKEHFHHLQKVFD